MNGKLSKVLGRQDHVPFNGRPDRWTAWSRSLIGRHIRAALRHHMPAMTLVQPRVPLYQLCQRWEHHAWRLCPQVNLSIGMILRETVGGRSIIDRKLPSGQSAQGQPRSHIRLEMKPLLPAGVFDMPVISQTGNNRAEVLAKGGAITSDPPGFVLRSPLRQVFRRMSRRHTSPLLTEIEGGGYQILRRMVYERRRVEERVHRNIVIQKRKNFILTETDQTEMEPHHIPRVGGRVSSQAMSPPQINVEQLTEHVIRQIDNRIRAYRERRGKPF